MSEKVLLILADGMRPDGIAQCGHPFLPQLAEGGCSTMAARTIMPSVTLPCHMSLFHSVPAERHGVLTNTYVPPVRPVNGLVEQISAAKKRPAFFYNWEQLRDLSRPGNLKFSGFTSFGEAGDEAPAGAAMACIESFAPDFVFLYLGGPDHMGHDYGWMGPEYLAALHKVSVLTEELYSRWKDDYTFIVTADHGGHDRMHGTDADADMTIPIILSGSRIPAGRKIKNASILDIAPTVADLMGVDRAPEWEGENLLGKAE